MSAWSSQNTQTSRNDTGVAKHLQRGGSLDTFIDGRSDEVYEERLHQVFQRFDVT